MKDNLENEAGKIIMKQLMVQLDRRRENEKKA